MGKHSTYFCYTDETTTYYLGNKQISDKKHLQWEVLELEESSRPVACGFQSVFLKGPLDFHAGSHPHGWPTRQSPTQHFCFQNKKVHKYMLIVKIKIRQII